MESLFGRQKLILTQFSPDTSNNNGNWVLASLCSQHIWLLKPFRELAHLCFCTNTEIWFTVLWHKYCPGLKNVRLQQNVQEIPALENVGNGSCRL